MPHSVLVEIQAGGLLGLRHPQTGAPAETVTDINFLVGHAENRFGDLETVPCEQVRTDMAGYKIRRRG